MIVLARRATALVIVVLAAACAQAVTRPDADAPVDAAAPVDAGFHGLCAPVCARFVSVCGRACQLGDCDSTDVADGEARCPGPVAALYACAGALDDAALCHLGSTSCGPEVQELVRCLDAADAGP